MGRGGGPRGGGCAAGEEDLATGEELEAGSHTRGGGRISDSQEGKRHADHNVGEDDLAVGEELEAGARGWRGGGDSGGGGS